MSMLCKNGAIRPMLVVILLLAALVVCLFVATDGCDQTLPPGYVLVESPSHRLRVRGPDGDLFPDYMDYEACRSILDAWDEYEEEHPEVWVLVGGE